MSGYDLCASQGFHPVVFGWGFFDYVLSKFTDLCPICHGLRTARTIIANSASDIQTYHHVEQKCLQANVGFFANRPIELG